jgi:hypothetical protein
MMKKALALRNVILVSIFFTFLAINFILVYKLVSRLSGSLYLMSTTIKNITRKNYTKPYFSGNVEF